MRRGSTIDALHAADEEGSDIVILSCAVADPHLCRPIVQ